MIQICRKCGSWDWDKEVTKNGDMIVTCPKCGGTWKAKKLPLFILTGCSGVGKTTTMMELQTRKPGFIGLDADFFTFMSGETTEDYHKRVEQAVSLSADIVQSGVPVFWSMTGCIDHLPHTYNARFFSEIYCLALTCEKEELRKRMTEGRNITDEGWIQSSIEYNQYFQEHEMIGDVPFDTFDITGKSVETVADYVEAWFQQKMKHLENSRE